MLINNLTDSEVSSVIWLLNAPRVNSAEIHQAAQLVDVYSEGVMNDRNVRKWYRAFNEERTNIHDEEFQCMAYCQK